MTSVTKPTTRSSIRHSLNLVSMGKALADVINKEGRDTDSKKAKDISSRRLSTINLIQGTAVSRTSLGGDTKPSSLKRGGTPDQKTITRKTRRASVQSPVVEPLNRDSAILADSPGTGQNIVNTRASARRTRNLLPSSALPKYRPKSISIDTRKKTHTPVLAGTHRRYSGSGDEKEKEDNSEFTQDTPHSHEKLARPMSPLPRRLNFKVAGVSISTTSVPKRNGSSSPSTKISPPRPMKSVKSATAASVAASFIPRPPSSGSSVSSTRTPSTPKSSNLKNTLGSGRSDRNKDSHGGQFSTPPRFPPSLESPLARHSRRSRGSAVDANQMTIGNMSHISEGNSEDSEADDVEMLLAPVASLAAPTPAMPRIELTSHRQRMEPQTPTRSSGYLPTRANLSYLSPLPPDADDDSPSRRPLRQPGGSDKGRGSILSWEQLATEASRTLGEDEVSSMLADVPAPFRSGAVSPSPRPSHIEESPCLSALHSPGGYGSISQVLLPDVTPSPAVNHNHNTRFGHTAEETSAADAATVTFLRLQLASAENLAKERLRRLQSMEKEIHDLKTSRLRDTEELGKQVSLLEERLHSDRDLKERVDEERLAYMASIEDQLKQVQAFREQAAEGAVAKARMAEEAAMRSNSQRLGAACAANVAGSGWASVRDLAESELDLIRANREMLSTLLAGLDQSQRQLCLATA